jgi:hypothetical protein
VAKLGKAVLAAGDRCVAFTKVGPDLFPRSIRILKIRPEFIYNLKTIFYPTPPSETINFSRLGTVYVFLLEFYPS